jgi:hypothetical protein
MLGSPSILRGRTEVKEKHNCLMYVTIRSGARIESDTKNQHRSVKGQAAVLPDPGPNAMRHCDNFSCGYTKTNLPQPITISPILPVEILHHGRTRI